MCGIIAYKGGKSASNVLLEGLKRLEYRGYDSAGIAVFEKPGSVSIVKDEGRIEDLEEGFDFSKIKGSTGIGHTRWATHGDPSKKNSHPHTGCESRISVVHNGIIKNFEEIKESLSDDHEFVSDTDTEVIPHFFEEKLKKGLSFDEVIQEFFNIAEGSFAIVLIDHKTGSLYGLKNRSPLNIGVGDNELFIASDIYAFSKYTDKAVFLEDNEYVHIKNSDSFQVYDSSGEEVEETVQVFDWDEEETSISDFDHYMIKEIKEQPKTVSRLLKSLDSTQEKRLDDFVNKIKDFDKVIFTAAGTSYHASLIGVYYLQQAGVDAQALIASEFKNYERVDEDTLVIAVSQSGETMDVLNALSYAEDKGGSIASIVNVPYSSIQRESLISLEISAGQEVCVAATKTFTNQVVTMLALAKKLGLDINLEEIPNVLDDFITENEERIKEVANKVYDEDDIYILGRGSTYPIAREIALKLKEIGYVHAEGMMGGELKHGTLALVEEGTPVVSMIRDSDDPILSNVEEVESRGAESIRFSPTDFSNVSSDRELFTLEAACFGFLLSYYIGKKKGLPIDKPRNLAKSVTVE